MEKIFMVTKWKALDGRQRDETDTNNGDPFATRTEMSVMSLLRVLVPFKHFEKHGSQWESRLVGKRITLVRGEISQRLATILAKAAKPQVCELQPQR